MLTGFTQRFQVRFDECAGDEAARASTLLRYVIETAFAHSTAAGFPLAWYDGRGLHWLVRRARLDLHHAAPYGAFLDITTRVVGFRRIWARRRNTIYDRAGLLLGQVTIDWIFTDRGGNPTRIVPEMTAAFPDLGEPFEIERLDVGPVPASVQPQEVLVLAHQTDPRGHMNSAAYLDVFEDALVDLGVDPQGRPATYDLEYLRPVVPGELVHRHVWAEASAWKMIGAVPMGAPVVKARRISADEAVGSKNQ